MKTRILRGLSLAFVPILVAGCSGGDKPVWQEYITLPHYIWAYYDGPLTVDFRRLCVCISEPGEFSDTKVCSAEGSAGRTSTNSSGSPRRTVIRTTTNPCGTS